MRNTYKYSELYSGGRPSFVEGDVFRLEVPLLTNQVTNQVDIEKDRLVRFCSVARSMAEMMEYLQLNNRGYFRHKYIIPLMQEQRIVMTIPEKPRSRLQKYIKK